MQIELYSKIQNASDIEKIGMALGKSGMFGVEKSEAGIVILMTCALEQITPLQFCRTYDIIGGKPRKKAMAASAEFIAKGAKIQWLSLGDDVKRNASGLPISGEARAKITFETQTLEFSFSIEQAVKCGLVKPNSNWDKTPGNMLRARVCSNAIGVMCPSIYAGATDDDIYEPAVPASLNLAPQKTEVQVGSPESDFAPTKKKEAKTEQPVIDVPAMTVVQTDTEPPNEATKVPEKFIATVKEGTNLLSIDTVAKLTELLANVEEESFAWFVGKSWLKAGQPLDFISLKRAQSIIDAPEKFISVLKGGAK